MKKVNILSLIYKANKILTNNSQADFKNSSTTTKSRFGNNLKLNLKISLISETSGIKNFTTQNRREYNQSFHNKNKELSQRNLKTNQSQRNIPI